MARPHLARRTKSSARRSRHSYPSFLRSTELTLVPLVPRRLSEGTEKSSCVWATCAAKRPVGVAGFSDHPPAWNKCVTMGLAHETMVVKAPGTSRAEGCGPPRTGSPDKSGVGISSISYRKRQTRSQLPRGTLSDERRTTTSRQPAGPRPAAPPSAIGPEPLNTRLPTHHDGGDVFRAIPVAGKRALSLPSRAGLPPTTRRVSRSAAGRAAECRGGHSSSSSRNRVPSTSRIFLWAY